MLDSSTDDPFLQNLLHRSGTAASVVAPLFAAGEFLGVIAANFGAEAPTASIHDPDLHERLSGAGRPGRHRRPEPGAPGEGLPHGLARRPDRAAQPQAVRGPGGTGAGPLPAGGRAGLHVLRRSRPLQDGQRHPRPRRRGRPHPSGQPAVWWRRSVPRTRWPGSAGTSSPSCSPGLADQFAIDQLAQRSLEALGAPFERLRPGGGDLGLHRHRHGPRPRRLLRRAAQSGRRGHVPGQGPGPQRLPDVLGITGHLGPRPPGHRRGHALRRPGPRPRPGRVLPALPALHRPPHRRGGRGGGPHPLEPSDASACSSRRRSSPWPSGPTSSWPWTPGSWPETCRQARAWLDDGLRAARGCPSTWPHGTCPIPSCSTTSTGP